MTHSLAIAAGGAIGALLRFWISSGVYTLFGRSFPYGTLAVNVLGSLLMGYLYIAMIERMASSEEWRAFALIGLLGAFTTFSTFSIETLNLLEQARPRIVFILQRVMIAGKLAKGRFPGKHHILQVTPLAAKGDKQRVLLHRLASCLPFTGQPVGPTSFALCASPVVATG